MTALVPGTPVRLVRGEELLLGEVKFIDADGTPVIDVPSIGTISSIWERKGFAVSPVEPPTPPKPALLPEGWYLSRTMEVWWFNSMGYCNRANDTSGNLHQEEIQPYAPFTRLASRGVWQTEIVEEIATAIEKRIKEWPAGDRAAARDIENWVRREFGSVVGE